MKGLGNDSHIVYIQINKQKPARDIIFREQERNFFGGINVKEGFYFVKGTYNREFVEMDLVPFNIVLNNKTAFKKPHVIIEYSNGRDEEIYFNTDEEMLVFVKREFQGKEWRIFD